MLIFNKTTIFKGIIFNKSRIKFFSSNLNINLDRLNEIKLKYSEKHLLFTFKELRQRGWKELQNLYNIEDSDIKKMKDIQDQSKLFDNVEDFIRHNKISISELDEVCSVITKERLRKSAGIISNVVGSNTLENSYNAVGIRVGINNVSWCKINLNSSDLNVVCWRSESFFDVPLAGSPLDIMKAGISIANDIPMTNSYVMEKDKVTIKAPKINSNLYRLLLRQQQISSVILTALFSRNSNDDFVQPCTTCFLMRSLTTARCFNLYYGVETVSSETVAKAMLRKEYKGLKNVSSITIDDEILKYYNYRNRYAKEELNMVLLLTIAFFEKGVLEKIKK